MAWVAARRRARTGRGWVAARRRVWRGLGPGPRRARARAVTRGGRRLRRCPPGVGGGTSMRAPEAGEGGVGSAGVAGPCAGGAGLAGEAGPRTGRGAAERDSLVRADLRGRSRAGGCVGARAGAGHPRRVLAAPAARARVRSAAVRAAVSRPARRGREPWGGGGLGGWAVRGGRRVGGCPRERPRAQVRAAGRRRPSWGGAPAGAPRCCAPGVGGGGSACEVGPWVGGGASACEVGPWVGGGASACEVGAMGGWRRVALRIRAVDRRRGAGDEAGRLDLGRRLRGPRGGARHGGRGWRPAPPTAGRGPSQPRQPAGRGSGR